MVPLVERIRLILRHLEQCRWCQQTLSPEQILKRRSVTKRLCKRATRIDRGYRSASSTDLISENEDVMDKISTEYLNALKCYNHEFTIQIGGFKTWGMLNAPPPDIMMAFVFFHGLGSSSEYFMDVARVIMDRYGSSIPCVVLLPNSPTEMTREELGSDPNGKEAGFKWWDIIDPTWTCSLMMGIKEMRDGTTTGNEGFREKRSRKNCNDGHLSRSNVATEEIAAGVNRQAKQEKSRGFDTPAGLVKLRRQIDEFKKKASELFGVPQQLFAVGGFSMGAMLAADCLFFNTVAPLSIGLFSGAPVALGQWTSQFHSWSVDERTRRQSVPVIQCHGVADQLLPITVGRLLRRILRNFGLHHRWGIFAGDHNLYDSHIDLWIVNAIARLRDICLTKDIREALGLRDADFDRWRGRDFDTLTNGNILFLQDKKEFLFNFIKTPMRKFYGGSSLKTDMTLQAVDAEGKSLLREKRIELFQSWNIDLGLGMESDDERLLDSTDSFEGLENAKGVPDKKKRGCIAINKQKEIVTTIDPFEITINQLTQIKENRPNHLLKVLRADQSKNEGLRRGDMSLYYSAHSILRCCLPVVERWNVS